MFRRDHDVLHTGRLGDAHPFFGVELHRVELGRKLFVISARNICPLHDPLADTIGTHAFVLTSRDRIETPVDEHAKARLAPPTHALIALSLGFIDSRSASVCWPLLRERRIDTETNNTEEENCQSDFHLLYL